jgi:hypothetical protein
MEFDSPEFQVKARVDAMFQKVTSGITMFHREVELMTISANRYVRGFEVKGWNYVTPACAVTYYQRALRRFRLEQVEERRYLLEQIEKVFDGAVKYHFDPHPKREGYICRKVFDRDTYERHLTSRLHNAEAQIFRDIADELLDAKEAHKETVGGVVPSQEELLANSHVLRVDYENLRVTYYAYAEYKAEELMEEINRFTEFDRSLPGRIEDIMRLVRKHAHRSMEAYRKMEEVLKALAVAYNHERKALFQQSEVHRNEMNEANRLRDLQLSKIEKLRLEEVAIAKSRKEFAVKLEQMAASNRRNKLEGHVPKYGIAAHEPMKPEEMEHRTWTVASCGCKVPICCLAIHDQLENQLAKPCLDYDPHCWLLGCQYQKVRDSFNAAKASLTP